MLETEKPPEKALLVGITLPGIPRWEAEYTLEELASLTNTAGAEVVQQRIIQERKKIDPATFIGSGKVEFIANLSKELNVDTIIFDAELSPAQVKNLERITEKKIIDRTGIILDIFAYRAKTKEAKTQVELAQLQYLLPRLTKFWSHLSRQVGGIGTRGPGETQLEVDKRIIRDKISHLKENLKKIAKQRELRRRQRSDEFKVSLVGYTNAGKSTLLNALSNSNVFVEDRLFATLDPTVKIVNITQTRKFLLIDTVGFIQKLPPNLVASFRSTLEEIVDSDLLLHVIDSSYPEIDKHIKAVNKVLSDLQILDKPTIFVFNKIDKLEENNIKISTLEYNPHVFVSAKYNKNLDKLLNLINRHLNEHFISLEITLPIEKSNKIAKLYQIADILEKKYNNNDVIIKFEINKKYLKELEKLEIYNR